MGLEGSHEHRRFTPNQTLALGWTKVKGRLRVAVVVVVAAVGCGGHQCEHKKARAARAMRRGSGHTFAEILPLDVSPVVEEHAGESDHENEGRGPPGIGRHVLDVNRSHRRERMVAKLHTLGAPTGA